MSRFDIAASAEITRRVIARDGFDGYLPTLCLPARKRISVLEGIPIEKMINLREIALEWAHKEASQGEEFFLVYKKDACRFRIVHRHEEGIEERIFLADTAL